MAQKTSIAAVARAAIDAGWRRDEVRLGSKFVSVAKVKEDIIVISAKKQP
jgi:hypothetical protein